MANNAITFGILLVVLGVSFWVHTGSVHVTALIPAFLGVVIATLGLVARAESRRKLAMHIVASLALLGAIAGLARGLPGTLRALRDEPEAKSSAAIEQTLMGLLCLALVVLCFRSFVAARRARSAG